MENESSLNFSPFILHDSEEIFLATIGIEKNIDNYDHESFPDLLIERLSKIDLIKRKCEILSTHKLLKLYTSNHFQVIQYSPENVPQISGSSKQISISHSNNTAALVVSPYLCGVDIETISTRIEKIKHKFLSRNEIIFVENNTNTHALLTLLWTVKEAVFKVTHEHSFINMETQPFLLKERGEIIVNMINNSIFTTLVVKYRLLENEYISWLTYNENK